jgi:protein-arginine kinase activator protein McsA
LHVTTKYCSACQQSRPLAEFNVRRASADGLQNICRACNRAKARTYYAEHREAHIRVIMARKAQIRRATLDAVGEFLHLNPCTDCGEQDVRVLDFDHRPGVEKSADVMKLVQDGYSLARVMDEIAKCDVRCRNCHAKVTYERMGENWRSALMRRAVD